MSEQTEQQSADEEVWSFEGLWSAIGSRLPVDQLRRVAAIQMANEIAGTTKADVVEVATKIENFIANGPRPKPEPVK